MRKTIADLIKPRPLRTEFATGTWGKFRKAKRNTWVACFELTRYVNERIKQRQLKTQTRIK